MNKKNIKIIVLLFVLVLLIVLNILTYSSESERDTLDTGYIKPVQLLQIPSVLIDNKSYQFSRDIFSPVLPENSENKVMDPIEEPKVDPDPGPLPVIAETNMPKFQLKGIGKRKGRPFAMVEYKDKILFLSEGDVLEGRFVITTIDESKVYVSIRQN